VDPEKDKKPSKVGSSKKNITPAVNTRKEVAHMKKTGGSATTRTLRKKKVIPKLVTD